MSLEANRSKYETGLLCSSKFDSFLVGSKIWPTFVNETSTCSNHKHRSVERCLCDSRTGVLYGAHSRDRSRTDIDEDDRTPFEKLLDLMMSRDERDH